MNLGEHLGLMLFFKSQQWKKDFTALNSHLFWASQRSCRPVIQQPSVWITRLYMWIYKFKILVKPKNSNQIMTMTRTSMINISLTCIGSRTPTLVTISSIILGFPSHCNSNSIVIALASPSTIETPKNKINKYSSYRKTIFVLCTE